MYRVQEPRWMGSKRRRIGSSWTAAAILALALATVSGARADVECGESPAFTIDNSEEAFCGDSSVFAIDNSEEAFCGDSPVFAIDNRARGDLDCDGTYGSGSFGDINPFVLILTNPGQWQTTYPGCPLLNGDMNCDGTVDFGDINPFVACLSSGDCDCP